MRRSLAMLATAGANYHGSETNLGYRLNEESFAYITYLFHSASVSALDVNSTVSQLNQNDIDRNSTALQISDQLTQTQAQNGTEKTVQTIA